jgi:hypothetical protein
VRRRRTGDLFNIIFVLGMAAAAASTGSPLPALAEAAPAAPMAGECAQHRLLDQLREGRTRSQSRPVAAAGVEMHRGEVEGGAAGRSLPALPIGFHPPHNQLRGLLGRSADGEDVMTFIKAMAGSAGLGVLCGT